jgi:hypothetical protein
VGTLGTGTLTIENEGMVRAGVGNLHRTIGGVSA